MDPGTAGAIGGMIVGAVIPIVSIIGGLAFAAYALWLKARLREMQQSRQSLPALSWESKSWPILSRFC